MIPILFPADSTWWRSNNGLGGLPDAINCIVTEQRNTAGGYWLEMDYPVNGLHFDLLAPERIIYAAPAMGQRPQPFRISRITRPINGIVHIEAPHISVELQKITTYGTRIGTNIGAIGRGYFSKAREIGQSTHFDFASNITTSPEITIAHPEPVPIIDVLLGAEGSFLDLVGGEYEFDEFDVVLHAQRGVDSGLEIRYGVNMSDLEAETDATELVTACVPFWKGTVNEQDVIVIGDMCTADNASAYAYVRCVPLDVTEQFDLPQDTQPTKADVTAKGTTFINSTSRKLLQTSIRVSYEPTTSGIGERRINLCDTVRVVYPDLNVSSISKVVETRFNTLTERYDELTIGTIQNNIVDTIAGLISGGSSYSGGGSGSGGGGSSGAVLYNMPQNLNEAQQAQARQNIGVLGAGVLSWNGMTGAVVYSPPVTSVNGKMGEVVLSASDVGAVASESGKGLSTNDFTTAEKNKLSGIAAGAEVNVQADWNQTDSSADDFIKNKPSGVMLPPFSNSDAFKHLRVNYNGSGVEWFAESGDHTIFFMNESTLAIDGATGSDISHAILADFKSVYIVSNESYSGGVRFHVYQPLCDDAPTRDLESVQFYRPSADGIVVLTIGEGQSVATKTTIPFGSGSGAVDSVNGQTGTVVLDADDVGAVPNTTGIVLYDQAQNLTDAQKAQARTNIGAFPLLVSMSYSNDVWSCNKDASWLMSSGINSMLYYQGNRYFVTSFVASGGSSATIYYQKQELDSSNADIDEFKFVVQNNAVTITRSQKSYGDSVFYYVDGTNIKSAKDNTVKTGQQIYNETVALGLSPVVYEYDRDPVYANIQYHFYQYDSGGLVFRRLDGKADIRLAATSTTLVKTINGYNTPYNIFVSWNSSEQKYYIRRYDASGNYHNAGYKELDYYAEGLMLDGRIPVSKLSRSGGWIGIYFNDFQVSSNDISIVSWRVEASSSNGVTVTRTVKTFQLIEYYTVTLNADGTVNARDSNLKWSDVSARMSYPNCADYLLVTWGNSFFTAKAIEKLTNGDIKFICDVEHDGIQRHMIFTLTSANALQTTLIETYSRVPLTVWEVADVTQGLIALNTNISSSLAWQLTGLNLTPFKRIKVYVKAGRKTGALSADSSITAASIIEMSLDDRAKETVSQNVFIGSSVVQNPNDPNRLGIITCAVSSDKTKFAVVRATTLYGTAATSNTDAYPYVFKIEGYYD